MARFVDDRAGVSCRCAVCHRAAQQPGQRSRASSPRPATQCRCASAWAVAPCARPGRVQIRYQRIDFGEHAFGVALKLRHRSTASASASGSTRMRQPLRTAAQRPRGPSRFPDSPRRPGDRLAKHRQAQLAPRRLRDATVPMRFGPMRRCRPIPTRRASRAACRRPDRRARSAAFADRRGRRADWSRQPQRQRNGYRAARQFRRPGTLTPVRLLLPHWWP